MSATATTEPHVHKWRKTAHLDGCHYYTNVLACTVACGATATVTRERDPKHDPFSAVWMEEQQEVVRRDERGRFITPRWEAKVCQRCDELKHGAPVRVDLVIVDRKGNIEREDHAEHEQREPEADE